MLKPFVSVVLIVFVAICWSITPVHAEEKSIIYVSAEKAEYKEVRTGLQQAIVWGDENGVAGRFTKFAPGVDWGMHTHTHDVWLLVIKGAYLYKDDAGEKRVGAGEFLRVPGGKVHWSGGDAKEGALFYQESAGKFDIVPAK